MEYSILVLWLPFVVACLHLLTIASFRGKLPPGPFPLPIFGNIFKLGNKPHESLAKLAERYGALMTLKLGGVTCIVVSSGSMAKEVLLKNDQPISGRTVPDVVHIHGYQQASMVWLPTTSQWRTLRKICTSQIFTKKRLDADEGLRLTKVKELMNYLRAHSKSKQTINIGQAAFTTNLNVVSSVIFSTNLSSLNSESSRDFENAIWGVLEAAGRSNLADYYPFLKPFDPQGLRRQTGIYFAKLDRMFDALIDQRIERKDQDASDDLLDTLLQHTSKDGCKLERGDLRSLFKDLFIAGTGTSLCIEWAMSELLRNRHIMDKARLEIKENCKKDQPIKDSDIARLPYLQAIVNETLRLHPPAPLLVPRRAETDIKIGKFTVHKHAKVLVNAWVIGRDPEVWVNPTSFLPERFLGSTVDFSGRGFEFIPFGAGRRICIGLPLAYRMVHLVLASLLKAFDWELKDGMKSTDIDMEAKFASVLQKVEPRLAIPVEV